MPAVELTPKEKTAIEDFFQQKGLPLEIAVTFDDLALPEQYSDIKSRSDIKNGDLAVDLLDNLRLNIPLISANMESVSGSELIVALEREGGLGIPPQSLPLENRLEILEKVLRADCAVIDDPLTISPIATLAEAKKKMKRAGISGLVVVLGPKKLVAGILSARDWQYETDDSRLVRDLMTSKNGKGFFLAAPSHIKLEEAKELIRRYKVEKLPLVDFIGCLTGLISARGLFYEAHYPLALRDKKDRFVRVGSIGVVSKDKTADDLLSEVEAQMEKGISALLIDTARGYAVNAEETIAAVKKRFSIPLIVGNVSTAEGAKFLFECGADCVKVGQGPGEACLTRAVAGIGIPQITAVAECSVIARGYGRTVIADGGIKSGEHLAKALIAGANAVMIGSLFCGTRESPPEARFNKDGFLVKRYEGSASLDAQLRRKERGDLDYIREPEGRTEEVPVTGNVSECVNRLLGGLRSAMSSVGARNIKELQEKGRFRRQTRAGYSEGVKNE